MELTRQPLDTFLDSLLPHVNGDLRKGLQSVKELLDLFPGQSPGEVVKAVRSLKSSSRNSVPALLDRAAALVQHKHNGGTANGSPADSADQLVADAGKLSLTDLRALAKGLRMAGTGGKPELLEDVRRWVESAGTYAPPSQSDLAHRRARELVGDLPERLHRMDDSLAREVLERAEAASKDKALGKEGFEAFAELLLRAPVKGSKPQILKKIKDFVNALAVSHTRTNF